jgi:hypothetical protein
LGKGGGVCHGGMTTVPWKQLGEFSPVPQRTLPQKGGQKCQDIHRITSTIRRRSGCPKMVKQIGFFLSKGAFKYIFVAGNLISIAIFVYLVNLTLNSVVKYNLYVATNRHICPTQYPITISKLKFQTYFEIIINGNFLRLMFVYTTSDIYLIPRFKF